MGRRDGRLRAADTGRSEFSAAIERLNPAWFVLVMACGIISVAAKLEGVPLAPKILLYASIVSYVTLWIAFAHRVVKYPGAVGRDVKHHMRAMGFLTIPAATAVLGSAFLLVAGWVGAAKVAWIASSALWAVMLYGILVDLSVRDHKPGLREGITGTWLVAVVATQGVSLLGTAVAPHFGFAAAGEIVFATLCLWMFGGMLYIWVMGFILYRLLYLRLDPKELSPTFWINMGAVAITALAGDMLIMEAARHPLTESMVPFLKGFTLLFWATSTWWIPWLVVMGVWRYVVRRDRVAFDPGWWGMVFPLGMYSTATFNLSRALGFPGIQVVAHIFFWVAIVAWIVTFILMVRAFSMRPIPEEAV